MSLKEYRPKNNGYGLNRSQTYDGPRRTAGSPPPSPVLILGQNMKSPRPNKRTGTKKGHKLPKVPRPARTLVMFSSVKKGIRECIEATEEDVGNLKDEDLSTESTVSQQVKSAERYKKRLEFHLSKIEELEENYVLQQQLREGAKTMARAYTSSGSSRQTVANVKHGFKECTQTMCAIEADLENMLGTFHCKMRGMVGFARLVPGDVFEVTIRHGPQKWKTKGRIKAAGQQWDTENSVFKALVGDVFLIKAVEQKSLAKSIILGQKNCDTKELFSASPQMMTININTNGSLKLSVAINWNPLEGIDETISYFEPPPKPQSTPKRRPPLNPAMSEQRHSSYISMEAADSIVISGFAASSSANSTETPAAPLRHQISIGSSEIRRPQDIRPMSSYDAIPTRNTLSDLSSPDSDSRKNQLFDMRLLADSLENNSPVRQEPASIEEALHNLSSILEDYQGQYPELQKLEEQIVTLDRLTKTISGTGSSRSSEVSVSIEAALGAFDFLEKEETTEGYSSSNNSRRSSFDKFPTALSVSPESTTRTTDSGIESIPNRLSDDVPLGDLSPSSPEPLSTGNDQVDQALLWHLGYCERLVENLGTYGPMKCKEIYSLDRLQSQADIIEKLIKIAKAGSIIIDLKPVLSEASNIETLQQFWMKCVDSPALYTSTDEVMQQLHKAQGDTIKTKYDLEPAKVFRSLCARILDVPSLDLSQKMTMHQMFSYFTDTEDGEINLDDGLQDLAGELLINHRLKSADAGIVIKTIQTFCDNLPPSDCLRVAALLLITQHTPIQKAVGSYLSGLCASDMLRRKAMLVYVEALEDKNADVRCAACMALDHLKATEAIDQLVYICQTDSSNVVKAKAKETLLSFGEVGEQALIQVQLSSHGFQGIRL